MIARLTVHPEGGTMGRNLWAVSFAFYFFFLVSFPSSSSKLGVFLGFLKILTQMSDSFPYSPFLPGGFYFEQFFSSWVLQPSPLSPVSSLQLRGRALASLQQPPASAGSFEGTLGLKE